MQVVVRNLNMISLWHAISKNDIFLADQFGVRSPNNKKQHGSVANNEIE